MTHDGDFLNTCTLLDLSDRGWQVIDAVFGPIHEPELWIFDSVHIVHLGVLDARVVGQIDVEAHFRELESHWFDLIRS